jgi:hypothetical protein
MGLRRQYIDHLTNVQSHDTNVFDQFPDPAQNLRMKTQKRYVIWVILHKNLKSNLQCSR